MTLGSAQPTVFEMCLALGIDTQRFIPDRSFWLNDPVSATQVYIDMHPATRGAPQEVLRGAATQALCLGAWAASGYPTLEITHRLAATLMATKIDANIEAQVVSPFLGVVVKMPDNLLFLEDDAGRLTSASALTFASYEHKGVPTFSYALFAQSFVSVFGTNVPHVGFVSDMDVDLDKGELTPSEVDERTSEMARKLIVGLCLYLSDPSKLGSPRISKAKKKPSFKQRQAGELPAVNVYQIGREIQLDSNVITGVREYVKHGSRAPSVQYIVRGHWKMQAYGQRHADRKLIHVEPYWRGPVDAPILTHEGTEGVDEVPAWMKVRMP